MNHKYEDIKEVLTEQEIDESYIPKALREYGLEEFPKSGLEDEGKNKLIGRAIDIAHSEAQLVKRKSKKGYLPSPEKQVEKTEPSGNLEIIVEDLKKVRERGKKILNGITYATGGVTFALPTMIRKSIKSEWDDDKIVNILIPAGGLCLDSLILYKTLAVTNPKLIPYIVAAQIGTNIASGIYEYFRHIKNKAKEEENLIEEDIHGTLLS